MTRLVFLDQNAWIALARGSWDKNKFPREHAALTKIVDSAQSSSIIVPLTFTNIYETSKINDPVRRQHIALTQALISGGRVFRSRRHILRETLAAYIAQKLSIPRGSPSERWFLSDLWFEAAADYSPETYGYEIPANVLNLLRQEPGRALFEYLCFADERIRVEAVRRYSASSAELIANIEARRAVVVGQTLAIRKRAYSARLILDEVDFILTTGRELGLKWYTMGDIGSSMMRGIAADVSILNVERELAVRLEDQSREIVENDLRDMMSFIVALPFADLVIAEKPFVNLALQAGLGKSLKTEMLTSVLDF